MSNRWILAAISVLALGCKGGGDKAAPASTDELETKSMQIVEQLADLFARSAGNCDKLSADLAQFFETKRADLAAIRAWSAKQTPAQKQALDAKYKGRIEQVETKLALGMQACKDNPKVLEAMKLLK
ncbi:MAG TPA: hypothetical protein VFQ53_32175 [Kofleriaceae bacterium]|nr:hypothetical protein [Kofleriaceae bacterium]